MNAHTVLLRITIAAAMMTSAISAYAACSVNSSGLNFGNYDPSAALDKLGAGTIAVNCSLASAYTISLSAGQGTFSNRTLKDGRNSLSYNLFIDVTRLLIWGDGTAVTSTVGGVGTGANVNVTAYGKMPAQQNVRVGSYSDAVVITIAF